MVYLFSKLAASLAYLAVVVSAVDIRGEILRSEILSDPKDLGAAKVILDDGRYSSSVTRNGDFIIPHVEPGTYILQVLAPSHYFDQFRIDVLVDSDLPEVRPYTPGTPLNPPAMVTLPYPLRLQAKRKLDFFIPKESFNLLGMLKNPMMLMMIVTAGMVMGVPYLMKNLDPETLKEITEQQQKMAKMQDGMDLSSGLSNLLNSATADAANDDRTGASPSKGKAKPKRR